MNEGKRSAGLRAAAVLLALAHLPVSAWALGSIHGIVLNGMNGAPVPGALLEVESSEARGTTDLDGLFQIATMAGTHVVKVSKDSYSPQRVAEVVVNDGDVTQFSVVLMPAAGAAVDDTDSARFAESITVTTDASAVTESAVLLERKQSAQISDLIGQEEFAKNPGGDAAGVLSRVTGVSVQDGKYVYVRGLGDRYSNTTLNGSKLPSTEFEKKVVPLDLFPSNLLDKVSISKSYSAKFPGDFAAGSIDMQTRQFPPRQSFSIGLNASTNSVTTGKDFLTVGDGLSSSGSGGQPLPAGIPDAHLVRTSPITGAGFSAAELEGFGEELIGYWSPRGSFGTSADSAADNYGFDLSYGNTFGKFGVLLSALSGSDRSNVDETRLFYNLSGGELQQKEDYDLERSTESVRQGAMANLSYAFNGNHRIELRSIFTEIASAEGRFQQGFFSDVNADIRDYLVNYRDQEISNFQLRGEHYLPGAFADGSLLEWRAGQSKATTDENRRQTLYLKAGDGAYRLSNNSQSGFMFFNDLEDTVDDRALDWSTFKSGDTTWTIQAGLAQSTNERDFGGRRLRFFHRGTTGIDLTQSPDQLFTAGNIRPDGFEVEEITRSTDTYLANQDLSAAYAQVDAAWKKWRLIAGVRYEDSQIQVETINRNNPDAAPILTELDEQEYPFAASLVYQLKPEMNLRFVASQTVNRPAFRELAPFTFTHIVGGYAIQGNPDLVSATIQSYDVRWEWFPAARDVIAASVFLKSFDNPIEQVAIPGAELLETFDNAESAENYGLELELRRNLGGWGAAFEDLTVVLNYTYVDSEIHITTGSGSVTNARRPLAGQPDNVVNAVLEWDHPEWGSLIRVLYNFTGDKISSAGAFGLPDIFEDSRATIDLTYIQDLSRGLRLKLSGRNLMDEEWTWSQGGLPFRSYKPGRTFSLGLSWSL
jgi:Outer membrane protein beta-barrel family/Carboxypeptidase regulatory-like domain/TonB-dependent Receptor Plug Domain